MLSFRPAFTFLAIFGLLTILSSSCTITQRRYRSGFHLEWKHRYKGQESVQANNEKVVSAVAEQTNTDTVIIVDHSIRPVEETTVPTQQDQTSESQIVYHSFPHRSMSSSLNLTIKSDGVNQVIKTDVAKKSIQKKHSAQGGLSLVGFLFVLAVLIVPPLLFSVAAYWIDLSGLELVFVWIIWVAGIVAALLLFSGLWPIILACLIWNVVFTIVTLIIALVNS